MFSLACVLLSSWSVGKLRWWYLEFFSACKSLISLSDTHASTHTYKDARAHAGSRCFRVNHFIFTALKSSWPWPLADNSSNAPSCLSLRLKLCARWLTDVPSDTRSQSRLVFSQSVSLLLLSSYGWSGRIWVTYILFQKLFFYLSTKKLLEAKLLRQVSVVQSWPLKCKSESVCALAAHFAFFFCLFNGIAHGAPQVLIQTKSDRMRRKDFMKDFEEGSSWIELQQNSRLAQIAGTEHFLIPLTLNASVAAASLTGDSSYRQPDTWCQSLKK